MSKKYYTQNGEHIKNPVGYAKMGAPMYESPSIYDTNNVNKETFIYKLDLEDGKKYIGKTGNFEKRIKQKWKIKNEKWKMKNEKWEVKNEKWKISNEKWYMRDEK